MRAPEASAFGAVVVVVSAMGEMKCVMANMYTGWVSGSVRISVEWTVGVSVYMCECDE